MNNKYEERLDVLAWNVKTQESLHDYYLSQVESGVRKLKDRPVSALNKRDRNWKIFIMRYQYRLTFNMIGEAFGITTERIRQLVFHEVIALKAILKDTQE